MPGDDTGGKLIRFLQILFFIGLDHQFVHHYYIPVWERFGKDFIPVGYERASPPSTRRLQNICDEVDQIIYLLFHRLRWPALEVHDAPGWETGRQKIGVAAWGHGSARVAVT